MNAKTDLRITVAALLTIHTALLLWSACIHSPSVDEVANFAAGIDNWRTGRFSLLRVNPPLIRMAALLPGVVAYRDLTIGNDFDRSNLHLRPEFGLGKRAFWKHGVKALSALVYGRWACIPLSLLGGYVCFAWARELFGTASGLMALSMWCFCPNVLAYAQIIVPDLGATATGVAACYAFWRWTRIPCWRRALVAGLALGVCELCKTTWVILYAVWPVLGLLSAWRRRPHLGGEGGNGAPANLKRYVGQFMAILIFSVFIINAGYRFERTFNRLGDIKLISKNLKCPLEGHQRHNRFTHTILGRILIPLPLEYVRGIDCQKYGFENTKLLNYFRGQWSLRGWRIYYLYAMAVKIPLGYLTLLLLALAFAVRSRQGRLDWLDELSLLLPPAIVLLLVSSQTTVNRHIRYVVPALPFLYIAASRSAKACFPAAKARGLVCLGVVMALLWGVGSSLRTYPHSLSYFNEAVGGPLGGRFHLLGSNLDWGQDLILLKRWLAAHPEARNVKVLTAGPLDPLYFGIGPDLSRQVRTRSGWYAVSVHFLHRPGSPVLFLNQHVPEAYVGHTIYIYHLGEPAYHGHADNRLH